MIYGVILCVGDSLITGARDEYGMSVPKFLGDELSTKNQKWLGIEEGVNGETSGELIRRLYKVVRAYPEAKDVVVCTGTNDAKTPRIPPHVFHRNYEEIFRTMVILNKHCYACLLPVREGFGAPDYVDANAIGGYNASIRGLAEENADFVSVVDLTDVPKKARPDGIHFNAWGDQWVAKKIADTIREARS